MCTEIDKSKIVKVARDFKNSCEFKLKTDSQFYSAFMQAASKKELDEINETSLDIIALDTCALFGAPFEKNELQSKILANANSYAEVVFRAFTLKQVDLLIPIGMKERGMSQFFARQGAHHLEKLSLR